jgi:LVIVD repeat-containing protein
MRHCRCLVPLALGILAALAFSAPASANHANNDVASPNLFHVGNSKPSSPTVNSDLAFWGNLVYAGNYNGFRIIDVADPSHPNELVDYPCRGPQNDVSVWGTGTRRLLFQSVDSRQAEARCSGDDPTRATGWEGIRIFDVTNPTQPRFIRGVATDCGSHTHTLIPVRKTGTRYVIDAGNPNRVLIYVSSYPLTGQGVHGDLGAPPEDPFNGQFVKCENTHNQISIVNVPLDAPGSATVRRHPLHADTRGAGAVPVRGCHDIQVYLALSLAAASCLGEGQIWDISNPIKPKTTVPRGHTHIRNEFPVGPASPNSTEIWHSAQFTWDGRYVVFDDEHAGAEAPGCGGSERTGNGWIYRVRRPPTLVEGPLGHFTIPRNQFLDAPPPQECTIHNGNFITTVSRYLHASAWYKGGSNVIDWTNPRAPREAAFFDEHNADGRGHDDVWSTYWYNGLIISNGGLDRPQEPNNRGVDIYRLRHPAVASAVKFRYMNPQTQGRLLTRPDGGDDGDDD